MQRGKINREKLDVKELSIPQMIMKNRVFAIFSVITFIVFNLHWV